MYASPSPSSEQVTSPHRIKILYIAGAGRSASTLLGQLLGQLTGFCFVGEMIGAWRTFGVRRCGCHALLTSCDFWSAVRRTAGRGAGEIDPTDLFALGRLARWRHMPLTVRAGRPMASRFGERWSGGERLYEVVASVSDARVIVDSSKSVVYGRMLSLLPNLDVHIVHLVRDARAVAYSWIRRKPVPDNPDQAHMNNRRPGRSAINWLISNAGAEILGRRAPDKYLRLRYEDFVDRPRDLLGRILALVSETPSALPFSGDRTLVLSPTHSVKGNPDRFRTGPTELRIDDEWKRAMRPRDRRLVTSLTWPLLLRYGYATSPGDA